MCVFKKGEVSGRGMSRTLLEEKKKAVGIRERECEIWVFHVSNSQWI